MSEDDEILLLCLRDTFHNEVVNTMVNAAVSFALVLVGWLVTLQLFMVCWVRGC